MIDSDFFEFEQSPWEAAISALGEGDSFGAMQLLTMLEDESEETVEDALQLLEENRITLDTSDLPKPPGTGEAALRLHREEKLVQEGHLLERLEENDPLRLYLEELASIPVCGDPEVLALEAENGADGARERLVNLSLSRVVELAQEFTGKGVLLMDLIQEGSLGLWQCILNEPGASFCEKRDWWIRQYMSQVIFWQARARGVGQKMRQAMEDYRAVDEKLLTELGRNPTMEEIAEEMHMSVEEAENVKLTFDAARLVNQAHIQGRKEEEEDPDDQQAVEDTAYFQSRQRIAELLSDLSEEDSKLVSLRFGLEGGLPLSPEETGRKLGLTPEEVVKREAAALAALRRS